VNAATLTPAAPQDLAPAAWDTNTFRCDKPSCATAESHPSLCDCACKGAGHGHEHRRGIAAAAQAFLARSVNGFTPAMLAAIPDDEPF